MATADLSSDADLEGRAYLDRHCRYDPARDTAHWQDPPAPGSWIIGSTFHGDGLLGTSNWASTLRLIQSLTTIRLDGRRRPGGVYILRARSWLCRWIDILVIEPGAGDDVIRNAAGLKQRIADYGVLDDLDYARRRHRAAEELWSDWPANKRRQICRTIGLPATLARRKTIANRELLTEVEQYID